ncbi:hypothetical protein, partial [Rhodovulum sulfidophilum]|uniref:hypothetical protein n=1 Tax=Rhodovulum sulfidophilum TaxID=35806 RepID=UPI001F41AF3C
IFSKEFYKFFSRKSVSRYRVICAQASWVGLTILSSSFVLGYYTLRMSLDGCVDIQSISGDALSDQAIVGMTDNKLFLADCLSEGSFLKGFPSIEGVTLLDIRSVVSLTQRVGD